MSASFDYWLLTYGWLCNSAEVLQQVERYFQPTSLKMKRAGLFIGAIMLITALNAQRSRFPSIEFDNGLDRYTAHVDSVLGISGANHLVVAWTVSAYPSLPSRTYYVVHPTKGRVVLYFSNNRISDPVASDLEKVVLDRKRSKEFHRLLWSSFDSTGVNIVADSLNLTSKAGRNGETRVIDVSDGGYYILWIWGPQGTSRYMTYSPDIYIRSKYPGWTQRKRFMDLWELYLSKAKVIERSR